MSLVTYVPRLGQVLKQGINADPSSLTTQDCVKDGQPIVQRAEIVTAEIAE